MDLWLTVGQERFRVQADHYSVLVGQLIEGCIDDITGELERVAETFAGHQTGRLAAEGIDTEAAQRTGIDSWEGKAVLRYVPDYGIWHHEGTGIFGTLHSPIFPQVGTVLVFFGQGRLVFARSVLGQKPHPFMHQSYDIVSKTYAPVRIKRLEAEILAAQSVGIG